MDVSALKAFAIKEGASEESLVKRPLTWDEFSKMGSAESHWHCVANSKAVDAVHEAHSKDVRQVHSLSKAGVAKLYANESETPEIDRDNAIHNFQVFMASYPQYINLPVQAAAIFEWLRVKSLYPEVQHIETAFKALARDGKLKIDPSQTGLVDETKVTGKALEFHPQVNRLLESVTPEIAEQRRVMRMDSKTFAEWERKAKGPEPLPFVIEQRIKQAFVTLADRHPDFRFNDANKTKLLEYLNKFGNTIDSKNVEAAFSALRAAGQLDINENVLVRGEYGTITDYSQIEPKRLTDRQVSLADKVARMDADEFSEFISKPSNRRAVDNL